MAFDKTGISLQYFGGGSGVRVWTYTTTDSLDDIQVAGYFADSEVGPADIVMVSSVDDVRYPTASNGAAHLTVDSAGTASLTTAAANDLALRTAA